jgi:Cu(I)/Ag(I) efflux system periplasmic protein CusF
MRRTSLIAASAVALAASAVALAMTGLPPAALAQSAMVDGTVRKIDQSAGKITLRHGPIKKLDMDDGMTMVFRVKDPAMLKQVKVGDKVKFDADKINGQFTVTRIEKAK